MTDTTTSGIGILEPGVVNLTQTGDVSSISVRADIAPAAPEQPETGLEPIPLPGVEGKTVEGPGGTNNLRTMASMIWSLLQDNTNLPETNTRVAIQNWHDNGITPYQGQREFARFIQAPHNIMFQRTDHGYNYQSSGPSSRDILPVSRTNTIPAADWIIEDSRLGREEWGYSGAIAGAMDAASAKDLSILGSFFRTRNYILDGTTIGAFANMIGGTMAVNTGFSTCSLYLKLLGYLFTALQPDTLAGPDPSYPNDIYATTPELSGFFPGQATADGGNLPASCTALYVTLEVFVKFMNSGVGAGNGWNPADVGTNIVVVPVTNTMYGTTNPLIWLLAALSSYPVRLYSRFCRQRDIGGDLVDVSDPVDPQPFQRYNEPYSALMCIPGIGNHLDGGYKVIFVRANGDSGNANEVLSLSAVDIPITTTGALGLGIDIRPALTARWGANLDTQRGDIYGAILLAGQLYGYGQGFTSAMMVAASTFGRLQSVPTTAEDNNPLPPYAAFWQAKFPGRSEEDSYTVPVTATNWDAVWEPSMTTPYGAPCIAINLLTVRKNVPIFYIPVFNHILGLAAAVNILSPAEVQTTFSLGSATQVVASIIKLMIGLSSLWDSVLAARETSYQEGPFGSTGRTETGRAIIDERMGALGWQGVNGVTTLTDLGMRIYLNKVCPIWVRNTTVPVSVPNFDIASRALVARLPMRTLEEWGLGVEASRVVTGELAGIYKKLGVDNMVLGSSLVSRVINPSFQADIKEVAWEFARAMSGVGPGAETRWQLFTVSFEGNTNIGPYSLPVSIGIQSTAILLLSKGVGNWNSDQTWLYPMAYERKPQRMELGTNQRLVILAPNDEVLNDGGIVQGKIAYSLGTTANPWATFFSRRDDTVSYSADPFL